MLIKQVDLKRIAAGEVTLVFRRWRRPTVRAGGTLRTSIGVLSIESLEAVAVEDLTLDDARAAGFEDREELLQRLAGRAGDLYRIGLRLSGPDPRVELRRSADLSDEEHAEVRSRLARMDRSSTRGEWTRSVLTLIRDHEGARAGDLAEALAMDKPRFKARVRTLKNLGLTESLSVGYRLSPRGAAVLAHIEESD